MGTKQLRSKFLLFFGPKKKATRQVSKFIVINAYSLEWICLFFRFNNLKSTLIVLNSKITHILESFIPHLFLAHESQSNSLIPCIISVAWISRLFNASEKSYRNILPKMVVKNDDSPW